MSKSARAPKATSLSVVTVGGAISTGRRRRSDHRGPRPLDLGTARRCQARRVAGAGSDVARRGANGIDGTVSAAFGAAALAAGPAVLLIGDVALAHEIGGLLAARRLGLALTIVVINNGGGGICHSPPRSPASGTR